jgi:peptidyl-prolyl cis-trans isomerase SurA
VELAHVFLGLRADEKSVAAAQEKLDRVGRRLAAGESCSAVARDLSDDPRTRQSGGELGWFEMSEIDDRLRAVAADLKPGEVSEPFQVPLGVELLRLVAREGDRVHLQHIHVALVVDEEDRRRLRERAEGIRRQAAGGKDFAELAKTHSDDRDSAAKGGSLGTFDDQELNSTISGAVGELAPGEVSKVVETEQGFHVFKVIQREGGGEYELAEIRDRLRNRMVEERAAVRTQAWLPEIRANYFIRRADQEKPGEPAPPGLGAGAAPADSLAPKAAPADSVAPGTDGR